MNLLTFVLMTVVILNYVTSTNVGFGSYLPGLSDPSYGLWTGGLGGGYGQLSGYGGPTFPSSNGYLPKRVKNHEPIVLEGGYENGNKFGNGGLSEYIFVCNYPSLSIWGFSSLLFYKIFH
ncbi:hypothetical protein ACJMK2_013905 [Sinanodonta woodiana]|uniref:Uncharacterized protein n=1 Tax=Sinanodonta woodiana TaxID=1069815 RepID=A0ABD3UYZ3_SINWO